MTATPRAGAPDWAAAQASPWLTENERARRIEAGAGRYPVADRVTAPPGTCADGANYIIIATAAGVFAGKEGQIATAVGTNAASGWYYRVLTEIDEGVLAYVQDEDAEYKWTGSAWAAYGVGGLTIDTDGTLAANSDTRLATQKAVKTYVDTAVTGLMDLKGGSDCSANPNYPAASKGDAYWVTVAGKIGGASGDTVEAGDLYFATADNAGGTKAAVGASWDILQFNQVLSGLATASTTEQLTGTDTAKAATSDSVAALWEKGADIASSGTLTVGEGGYFVITGTTTITALALSTDKAGRKVWLKFAGALTLTHNATSLILPSGANITTAAGDIAGFVSEGSGNFRCICYQRADGTALVGSNGSAAASSDLFTATNTTKFINPAVLGALWTKGSDIASASTVTFGDGGFFHVTGTTTITALAFTNDKAGRVVNVEFTGALTLTHNATSLILPGGANITTAAGDCATFVSEGSGNFRCVVYQKANGQAVVSSGGGSSDGYTALTLSGSSATVGGRTLYAATATLPAVNLSATVNKVFLKGLVYSSGSNNAGIFLSPNGTEVNGWAVQGGDGNVVNYRNTTAINALGTSGPRRYAGAKEMRTTHMISSGYLQASVEVDLERSINSGDSGFSSGWNGSITLTAYVETSDVTKCSLSYRIQN